ncbi:hypothetical protein [Burkholderia cenocepacia]|uniref:Uncharacterized protein n=1 Tax=Burkholderia phage Magia TaxID=2767577 RepID=A0A873WIB9_9CAUD|nr:hypothetical protein [Burkholderia cenocepacia]YP_010668136.1 hypothetical protein PQC04_gp40 [Burkholderia phage Magia]MBJ9897369.1 hypothetical protein [Burkholderia cenocepacia]MBJ9913942.1 hypothetical protein [Burkholderia cenocepacia]QPB08722.1 hypothetical protein CPT_Magia_040 [Burkholderia phage Magia]
MIERPILFSGPMVRAILEGRKTQTRRVMKHQPPDDVAPITLARYNPTIIDRNGDVEPGPEIFGAFSDDGEWGCKSPFGEPGDRLWVRETHLNWWKLDEANPDGPRVFSHVAAYAADGYELQPGETWIPSIHMLRAASRITLEITSVHVERLQSISESDARDEGVTIADHHMRSYSAGAFRPPSIRAFHDLWDSLNASRGHGWDVNPWVWVIEFKRLGAGE